MARKKWLIGVCILALGCGSGSGGAGCAIGFRIENRVEVERFETLRHRFFVRHLLFNPVTATYLGADGYSGVLQSTNGALKDYSEAALARELAFYRESHKELLGIDRESLPPQLRVDHSVMDAQLRFLVRLIAERSHHQRAVDTYTTEPFRGVDWQMQQMQDAGRGLRGTEHEWSHVASRVEAIPAYLDNAKVNLLAGRNAGNLPDWRMVQRDGIDASLANAEFFRDTLADTAAGYIGDRPFRHSLMPRLTQAAGRAAASWETFAAFLRGTYGHDTVDRFAAGIEEYEWRVRHVFGDTRSAAQLYDYGSEQVALYSRLIQEAVATIANDANVRATTARDVISLLAEDSPRNDDELFAWYREKASRAVAYGREHGMFEVPDAYQLEILPTPPVLQNSIDAAYYMAPPFRESGVGRFYLAATRNDPAKLRMKNRASIAATAIHEGFPGHDWHFKNMGTQAAQISTIRWLTPGAVEDSSSMWSDSLAAEGWALYAEELMAQPGEGRPYGFYSAPEHLYELQNQMIGAVRVRVDVGIHTGRMTFDEAREYYLEHVEFFPGACGMTDADARAACHAADRAIYRYSKWPTQALAYNLGKGAIVALREQARNRVGTAFSPRSFHEQFMRMGTVPIAFFRDDF